MENQTLPRRPTATIEDMGVNSYSTFGAQGNITDDKLTLLPVLQETLPITQEQQTSEAKHTLYDEQLSSSTSAMNWDMETNCIAPTVVHHSANNNNNNNNYVHLTECVLQATPSTASLATPQAMKLGNEDGLGHSAAQQSNKQNFSNFANADLNGSKVIRLVRAKQATKRKSSLDTLIEVVQKELLRVNGQSNSTSPSSSPPHYSQARSTTVSSSSKQLPQQQTHRSMPSSVLPSSHPGSLTSQTHHSLRTARKRVNHPANNTKRTPTNRHRSKSFNTTNDDLTDELDLLNDDDVNHHHDEQQLLQTHSNESMHLMDSSTENIEEIVRDTVDRLVAITLLNNAPFIVNMITGTPGNTASSNTETKASSASTNTSTTSNTKHPAMTSSDNYRNDLAMLSSTASELRNSMPQTSPLKQPLVIQPSPPTMQSTDPNKSSTLFVTPRVLRCQTVVPKPATNIQIGNTKIILVSPAANNSPQQLQQQQQQCLINNSPVKLVKLTPTLTKNVQIVIPSRTSSESLPTTNRPLTACSLDQIPQAAQEVTISTSPNLNKPRRRSSTTTPSDKPVGKILRPIAKVLPVYSPSNGAHAASPSSTVAPNSTHEDLAKLAPVHFAQRPPATHGPMIYRMTSMNPNVPVFRVRATTTPTAATMKTDVKPISIATATNVCYEPAQTHGAANTTGSVSVLACFKTTKKRNKERAIMPRPSPTETVDPTHDTQPRSNATSGTASSITPTNVSLIMNNHSAVDGSLASNNSSSFPTRLIQPPVLSASVSDKKSTTVHFLSSPQHTDSSNDAERTSNQPSSIKTMTTPLTPPLQSVRSPSSSRPLMKDKSIQCIDDRQNSTGDNEQSRKSNPSKKRNGQSQEDNSLSDESWTVAADTLLRNVLSQYGFRFLDVTCQHSLSTRFDAIQADLVSGMISSKDEFYKSVLDTKETLLHNGLSKISADNLEKLFHYFETEYPTLSDGDAFNRAHDRKRTRRQ